MPGAFIDRDVKIVFNPKDFGEEKYSVTIDNVQIEGAIFDNDDVEIETTGQMGADILRQPILTVSESDAANLAAGQTVVVRDVTYRVVSWMNEGDGTVSIYLGIV